MKKILAVVIGCLSLHRGMFRNQSAAGEYVDDAITARVKRALLNKTVLQPHLGRDSWRVLRFRDH
jgi:hypothetical protein